MIDMHSSFKNVTESHKNENEHTKHKNVCPKPGPDMQLPILVQEVLFE